MKCFVYETRSVAFEASCVEVVVLVAEDRDAADRMMLNSEDCWLTDPDAIDSVYQGQERPLEEGIMLRAKMYERLDKHEYQY
jgi:hypothetical protein